MNFSSVLNTSLPQLGWIADLNKRRDQLTVYRGASVEYGEHYIIEGCWNGSFEHTEFHKSPYVYGSGVYVDQNEVYFVPSSATTEALYYKDTPEKLVVSNSLIFLLTYLDERLCEEYRGYDRINLSVLEGIYDYEDTLPTTGGTVKRLIYFNLVVQDGKLRKIEKEEPEEFKDYRAYERFLEQTYDDLYNNMRSCHRTYPLSVITTQSRGYDTTAVNAVAAKWGIDKAYTVKQSKGKDAWSNNDVSSQSSDDGTEICNLLGIPCVGIDRRAFEKEFRDELWFHAACHTNEDANLIELLFDRTEPRVMLSGVYGEIWYDETGQKQFAFANDDSLKRGDLGMHGLGEIRLRQGVVHLPFPSLGARSRPSLLKITMSEEMAPWSLDRDYNRPIARRLAEERGIKREMFGQVKMASAVSFPRPSYPYSEELRREFLDYLHQRRDINRFARIFWSLIIKLNHYIYFHTPHKYRALYYGERIISKIIGKPYHFPLLYKKLSSSLFVFSVNRLAEDYKGVVKK